MLATTEAFSRFQFTTNPNLPRLDENEFRRRHAEYYVGFVEQQGVYEIERENIFNGADWCHVAKEWNLLRRFLHVIFPYLLSWNRTQFATRCIQGYESGIRVITLIGNAGAGKSWLAEMITKNFKESSAYRESLQIDRHRHTQSYREFLDGLQNIETEPNIQPQFLVTIDGVDEFLHVDELGLALAVRDIIRNLPQSVFLITSRRPLDWIPKDIEQENLIVGNFDHDGARQMWRELVQSYKVDPGLESEEEFELLFELTQGMPLAMAMLASALSNKHIRTLQDVRTGINNLLVTGVFERFLGDLSMPEKDILVKLAASDDGLSYGEITLHTADLGQSLKRLSNAGVIRGLGDRYVLHEVVRDLLRGNNK